MNVTVHKRLVYGKLVDKTLADIDYSELAEMLYGQAYAPDVARRMVYGSKRTLDAVEGDIEGGIQNFDVLSALEAKKIELQKERQRFFDQRREYNRALSMSGRSEHLEEKLVEAANNLIETVGTLGFESSAQDILYSEDEAVLVFCDWHYGMVADNSWNTYDTNICKKRVKHVVEAAVKRIQLHRCSRLHIVLLGDLIHGAIHTSARVASEELVCEQLMNAAEILAQAVEFLSGFVSETIVYATYGNHGRTVQKKNDNIHSDNMERIIPWWLKQRLKGMDNIEVIAESETEFLFFSVCEYQFCASHGDLDSVKTAPRLLPTLFLKKYNKNVDYILLADKHHRETFEELAVCAMVCGSLCGTDEYANSKRLYSLPEQELLIVSPCVGVDAEYHIKCVDR